MTAKTYRRPIVSRDEEVPDVNMQKGRLGEDIIRFGFRALGYQVFTAGIEHTESVNAYSPTTIKDPLFQIIRRCPDFLLTKGTGDKQRHIYVESKFWPSFDAFEETNSTDFLKSIVLHYLGRPLGGELLEDDLTERSRQFQDSFKVFENVYLIMMNPTIPRIIRLGDVLYVAIAGDGKIVSGIHEKWFDKWDAIENSEQGDLSVFKNDWAIFKKIYVKHAWSSINISAKTSWMR